MTMQHNTTMSSSSSAAAVVAKAKRGVVSSLQGPRPLPLTLPGTTSSSPPPRPAKRPRIANGGDDDNDVRASAPAPGPVILYEHTPKVIHARPDEFKALVQRLTGRQRTGRTAGGGDQDQEAVLWPAPAQKTAVPLSHSQSQQDPLALTLWQQQQVPPLLLDDHHHTPPVLMPNSPGAGGAGGFFLSPGGFLFSPATMQAIQELIS